MSEDGFKFNSNPFGSSQNIAAVFIPTVLQAVLTSSVLIIAARSSNMKKRWLSGETKWGVIPLHVKIQALIFFLVSMFFGIMRTGEGMLGFNGVEPGREGIYMNFYIGAFFVPFVTLATISRMHRRLDAAAEENERILGKESGIVEPKTVHGQPLKVIWSDADEKGHLLLRSAASRIANDLQKGGVEVSSQQVEERLEEQYTPARSFAAGVVGRNSDDATWKTLLGSLRNIDASGKKRCAVQIVLLLLSLVLSVYTLWVTAKNTTFDKISYSVSWTIFSQGSSLLGIWYEKWALTISSKKTLKPYEKLAMYGSWIAVQICLLLFPVLSLIRGQYGGFLLYVKFYVVFVWFGAVHEFVLNEAFIAYQSDEGDSFIVPPWGNLEADLKVSSQEVAEVI